MDLATLGIKIENGQAVQALNQFGDVSEKASARVVTSMDKSQQAALRTAIAFDKVHDATRQYSQITDSEMSKAVEWYDKMYGPAKKVADVQREVGAAGDTAVGGLGRMRQSLTSLAADATSTNPMLARVIATISAFDVGNVAVIGALAGVAAIGYAWKKLSTDADELAKHVTDAMKKIRGDTLDAQLAMGDLQIAQAVKDVAKAQADFNAASHTKYDAKTGLASGTEGDASGMKKALDDANRVLFMARQQKNQLDAQAASDARKNYADNLAFLVSSNHATAEERARAIALYRSDLAEIAALGKSQTDNVRRSALIGDSESLGSALYPKQSGVGGHAGAGKKPAFLALIPDSVVIKSTVEGAVAAYNSAVESAARSMEAQTKALFGGTKNGATKELLDDGILKQLRERVDLVKVTQARIDAENVKSASEGKGPAYEGPGSVMDTLRKSAIEAGEEVKRQMQVMGVSGWPLIETLNKINALYKELDITAKKTEAPSWMKDLRGIESGMRTAADAANLFGGKRGGQYANILNTAANATENVGAAVAAHGMNPLADAQAAISVGSLAKQIFGLGSQSHEAARQIREASESLKLQLSLYHDSATHNTLQGMLDQDRIAYNELIKAINDTLPGKKKQAEREAEMAKATADYNQQLAQTHVDYALQQKDFDMSLHARAAAARGDSYQASVIQQQIQQQDEMAAAIKNGATEAQRHALAQVQLAEKTKLANDSITQLSNSPTGFFAEKYFGEFATPAGAPSPSSFGGSFPDTSSFGVTPPPSPTSPGGASGSGVNIQNVSVVVPAANDPRETALAVVKAIRQLGTQYGGMGATISDTMELMS